MSELRGKKQSYYPCVIGGAKVLVVGSRKARKCLTRQQRSNVTKLSYSRSHVCILLSKSVTIHAIKSSEGVSKVRSFSKNGTDKSVTVLLQNTQVNPPVRVQINYSKTRRLLHADSSSFSRLAAPAYFVPRGFNND